MSHRDSVNAPPPGSSVTARRRRRRSPPSRTRSAASTASSSTRRSSTRPTAGHPEELPLRGRRRSAALDARRGDRGAGRADPRPGRARARPLRALRRRRLGGRRSSSTRPSATSSPASSSITACSARTRRSRSSRRSTALPRAARPRRARDASCGLAGVTDPEEKRKSIGEEFIRVFEEEGGSLGRVPVPGPGHALLRRDRVGRRRRRRGEHQVPPQRAGCPRTWSGARRAAPPALQGRGAAGRRGARPAETMVWRQPFPGRDSRSGSSARSPRTARDPPRRGRVCRRRWEGGALRTSGSASPCCPRSSRSASRATSGRTPTCRDPGSYLRRAMTADWAGSLTTCSSGSPTASSRGAGHGPGRSRLSSKPSATIEWE